MELTGIRFIDDLDLEPETPVFIRTDFNVPLTEDGEVGDDFRIRAAIPTIEHAVQKDCRVILASHLGRPGGERTDELSMEPVGEALTELMDIEVVLPEDLTGHPVQRLVSNLKPGKQVMLLENLRFDPEEKAADLEFAEGLAELADLYVNDAFGAMHRKHASVYRMAQFFDRDEKAAGRLVKSELESLGGLLDEPKRPFTALMGGAKVSDKLGVFERLSQKVDRILVGGAMAYTFLKADGERVGDSLVEEDYVDQAGKILDTATSRGVDIVLPLDHVVAPDMDAAEADVQTTEGPGIPDGNMGLDIGPRTVEAYSEAIRESRTVFWNGPMGVFEKDLFARGTMEIARTLALAPCHSVVGGGDSASAVRKAEVTDAIDHVSTGGGAALQLLEGKPLPGIDALRPNHPFDD
jgi:phosphoglycerate kinase